jgi:integrase/recombinase XerD
LDAALLDADPYTIESYLNGLKADSSGLSGKALQTRYYSLKSFFTYVESRKDDFENPLEPLDSSDFHSSQSRSEAERAKRGRDERKYLSPEGIEELIESAQRVRDKAIIGLLGETGVRAGELSRIRLANIDWDRQRITVESLKKQDQTKTRPVLWWTDKTNRLVELWSDTSRNSVPSAAESPYLFPTPKRERIREQDVNEVVKDAAERAGLQEVLWTDSKGRDRHEITAHTLRHSAIRRWVNDLRVSLPTVQKLAGHSSIDITEVYTEPDAEDAISELRDMARKNG